MPNHVINEVRFWDVDAAEEQRIRAMCLDVDGYVDFRILVPIPVNLWMFSHSSKHEKLGGNALDWCTANWGTKWNAYGQHENTP